MYTFYCKYLYLYLKRKKKESTFTHKQTNKTAENKIKPSSFACKFVFEFFMLFNLFHAIYYTNFHRFSQLINVFFVVVVVAVVFVVAVVVATSFSSSAVHYFDTLSLFHAIVSLCPIIPFFLSPFRFIWLNTHTNIKYVCSINTLDGWL